MPGQGVQHLPIRYPAEMPPYLRDWLDRVLIKDILAKMDPRNAQGNGVEISGQSSEVATFSVSEDLQQLFDADFAMVEPSPLLPNARTMAGESGVVELIDAGPGGALGIGIAQHGLQPNKLMQFPPASVLGNAFDGIDTAGFVKASANDTLLRRVANQLSFGELTAAMAPDGLWPYAKLDAGVQASLNLADTALQPGDPIPWTDITSTPSTLAGYGITDAYTDTEVDALLAGYQPLSSALTAYAGGNTPSTFTLGIVDSADAAAWRANIGAGTSSALGANPTATIGLTAVDGTAGTFTRSDAAPALSQAISPTWTGTHVFSGAASTGTSISYFSPGVSSGIPYMRWWANGAPVNAHAWHMAVSNTTGAMSLSAINDANSVSRNAFSATRSGGSIATIDIGNATDLPSLIFHGAQTFNGHSTVNGVITASQIVRGTGSTVPTSGVGTELGWNGTAGFVQAYNRSTATYQPLYIIGSQISFFGAVPVARPTVSGAKGGNAALTSLITAISSLGLVTDSTT